MKLKTVDFQMVIEKLTPETQAYLLNMANMAFKAEQAVREEIKKERKQEPKKAG